MNEENFIRFLSVVDAVFSYDTDLNLDVELFSLIHVTLLY